MLNELLKLKSLIVLLGVLFFSLFLGGYVPNDIKIFSYTLSLAIKDVFIFVLPLLIFSFVLSSIVNLREKAISFVLLLVPLICLSSYIATWTAYFVGLSFIDPAVQIQSTMQNSTELQPVWTLILPKLISNDMALLGGVAIGLILSFNFERQALVISTNLLKLANFILSRFIVPIMPVFILGFTLKLESEQILVQLCQRYLSLFVIIFVSVFTYLCVFMAFLSRFRLTVWSTYWKNLFTAMLTGFSAMSSAAAMPFTIIGSEKNTGHPEIARSIIPASTNIHLIGDCFAISIFALAILVSFGQPLPSFENYAIFAFYFVLAKFAVAAVPGGGILVMLPILASNLNFTGEMLTLITALYILFDPITTAANIAGNGALAILFTRMFTYLNSKKSNFRT